jgi:MFS family permease
LGWISYFADVASEMAYPILPLFLRSLGAPAAALGLIEGMADATANFLKGVAGIRSDQLGKRAPYIRWGYGLSAVGKPLIALAPTWLLVTVARVLDRYGKGIRTTARDAMLADAAPKGRLGAVFGLHRALDTAGAFTGVLVTLLLLQLIPGQYRWIFLLAGIPGLIAVLITVSLGDRPGEASEPARQGKFYKFAREVWSGMPMSYKRVVALHALFALANTSDTFLLLSAHDHGFSDSGVIGAYLFYNVAYAALSYPAGKLSDRIGRWPVVGTGWLIYGVTYLGFAWLGGSWLWPLFFLYGIYTALTQGVAKAQISEFAPPDRKGSALGAFYMISGICTLAGNLGFGLIWDRLSPAAAFTIAAALAIGAVALVPWVGALSRRVSE